MDNTKERFISEDELPEAKKKGHNISKGNVNVGDEFQLAGRTFIVRKVTRKDVICRPKAWK